MEDLVSDHLYEMLGYKSDFAPIICLKWYVSCIRKSLKEPHSTEIHTSQYIPAAKEGFHERKIRNELERTDSFGMGKHSLGLGRYCIDRINLVHHYCSLGDRGALH